MSATRTLLCALAVLACSGTDKSQTPSQKTDHPALVRRDRTIPSLSSIPRELAFSPDGLTLATSSIDSTVKFWTLQHGWPAGVLRHPASVASIAYSPDGKSLVSGAYDGAVRLWRVADTTLLRTLTGHTGTVWSVAFSPDGQRIASSGEDKTVRLWRAADGAPIKAMTGHTLNVWAVDFSADGKYLGSGSFDQSVRLWDPDTGAPVRTLPAHEQAVVGIAFSPDGKTLASSGDDNTIRLWNVETGQTIRTIEAGNHTYKIAFTHDGKYLVSGGRSRSAARTLVNCLSGGRLAVSGTPLKLWRVSDGALMQTLVGESDDIRSVDTSPDGKLIATASDGRTIRIWRFLETKTSNP